MKLNLTAIALLLGSSFAFPAQEHEADIVHDGGQYAGYPMNKPTTVTVTKYHTGRPTTITVTKNPTAVPTTVTVTNTVTKSLTGRPTTVTVTKSPSVTIHSTTSRMTRTSTTKNSCPTPTCGDHGVKYARYSNPYADDYSSDYSSFNLSYFESQTPIDKGVTNTIYLETSAANETFSNAALEYRTFLYACKAGTYSFISPSTDDATLMWFGEANVKNSTRENADIKQFWYGDNSKKVANKTIKADTYYPIRILWGNTQGAGFLDLQIYGPDGNLLTGGSDNTQESYLVTASCDSSYNPYGGNNGGSGKGSGSGSNGGSGDGSYGYGKSSSRNRDSSHGSHRSSSRKT